ncbi:MAG: HAD family phosphatase [Acidobacteria bacterium]|nr:HAD family phosphatase [Acidobacteriota bacterium]
MDGTLVDTEPYWIAAEHALVRAHGGQWTDDAAMALVGQSLYFSSGILQQAGVQMSNRDIIDHLTAEVQARVREHIPWRPGARELLHEAYQEGIACVMVTMSEGPLATEVVNGLPHPFFKFLVTGDSVSQGKPHPEPYLKAIDLLQAQNPAITAATCVALEDSVPGVTSAVAAGVCTVGIPHTVPLPNLGQVPWTTLSGRTLSDLHGLLQGPRTNSVETHTSGESSEF